MNLPASYIEILGTIPSDEISYGTGGIKLLNAAELESGQIGYAVTLDGASLCDGANGAWQSSWIVIGYDTACGDPVFIDTDDPDLPVFTAIHGIGTWKPLRVSISLKIFAASLGYFAQISKGRSNPVELERNPLSEDERNVFLDRIADLNERKIDPDFWSVLTSV